MTTTKLRSPSVPKHLKHYEQIKRFLNWRIGLKTEDSIDLSLERDDPIDTVAPEADPLEALIK